MVPGCPWLLYVCLQKGKPSPKNKVIYDLKNRSHSEAPVAHAYNPSCSEGRDQEDPSLKAAQANSLRDLISKNTLRKKRTGGVVQGVGPELKLQHGKKYPQKDRSHNKTPPK
jgi:hypothetical protein